MYFRTFFLFIISMTLAVVLTGCIPATFTAATSSTIAVSKNRSFGQTIDDVTIATKIKLQLMKHGFKDLYTKITVTVFQGRVMYTGDVEKDEDILKAIQVAWEQPGVVEVESELVVSKNSNKFDLIQYTRDSMLTMQTKLRTMSNKNIKFVNYTIITTNDVVYLFGIAQSLEELEQVTSIAAQVPGVQKVISHVKIMQNHTPNVRSEEEPTDL